jgi:Thiol:disulfide interchange protein DsbD, N-terminal
VRRLGELAEEQETFAERGADLYVVTVYDAAEVERWIASRGYPQRFVVNGGAVAEAFGVDRDRSRDGVPYTATVVLAGDGTVLLRAVHERRQNREAIPHVLEVIDAHLAGDALPVEPSADGDETSAAEPAGPPEVQIRWPVEDQAATAQPASVVLSLHIPEGAHVYGPGEEVAIPVQWSLGPAEGLEILGVEYPPPVRKELPIGVSHVYEGSVELQARFRLATGDSPVTVPMRVTYQVCTERTCYPPQEATGELVVSPTPSG